MEEKNVVILISSSPFSTLNNYEALRASIALYNHEITIIWQGKGVYSAFKTTEQTTTEPFLRLIGDLGINLYVIEEDINQYKHKKVELRPEVELLCRENVIELISKANVVITF